MKFKKLKPQKIENLIPMVKKRFQVDFAVLNGNKTYLTLVLEAK
jgi:hypothetical protein